jgi:hypothetical protein
VEYGLLAFLSVDVSDSENWVGIWLTSIRAELKRSDVLQVAGAKIDGGNGCGGKREELQAGEPSTLQKTEF